MFFARTAPTAENQDQDQDDEGEDVPVHGGDVGRAQVFDDPQDQSSHQTALEGPHSPENHHDKSGETDRGTPGGSNREDGGQDDSRRAR